MYARVTAAERDLEPVLACSDAQGKVSDNHNALDSAFTDPCPKGIAAKNLDCEAAILQSLHFFMMSHVPQVHVKPSCCQLASAKHSLFVQRSMGNKLQLYTVGSICCANDLPVVCAIIGAALVQASGFGPLKEGFLITSNTHYARRLLSRPPCAVLAALEKHLKQFEVAVGLNGKIWINSPSTARTVIACNAIQRAEFMNSAQTEVLVSKLVDVAKS